MIIKIGGRRTPAIAMQIEKPDAGMMQEYKKGHIAPKPIDRPKTTFRGIYTKDLCHDPHDRQCDEYDGKNGMWA